MIKEIKYNILIHNFLISLKKDTIQTPEGAVYVYSHGVNGMIILSINKTVVSNLYLGAICDILGIEYTDELRKFMYSMIKEIYGAKPK